MRVLVVHNRYRSSQPSGENRVVDIEVAGLRSRGHEVSTYIRSSDELDQLSTARKSLLATSPVHSRRSVTDVRDLVRSFRPDVLHLHNPYPLISMRVVDAAVEVGVPVVQTVHNHRHTCMKGTYLRDGHACHDCLRAGQPLPGVVHACYRGSRPQSAIMAVALVRDRRTSTKITRLIALTPDIRNSLVASGYDPEAIMIKPNSVPDPGKPVKEGTGFVFVGRLSEEKGVLALLEAWSRNPGGALGRLSIVGDGPARSRVEQLSRQRDDVRVMGQVGSDHVSELVAEAAVVVVPSLWAEAFPLVILEGMAAGRALLVTDQGGMPGIVDSSVGLVVEPTVAGLDRGLHQLAMDPAGTAAMGAAARSRYEATYSPGVVLDRLIEVYERARTAFHRDTRGAGTREGA